MLVWSVWAGMLGLLLWLYIPVSSPVPLAEDWVTVPFVTGEPADLGPWLWQQNNEHRMPVARLLLLGALKAGGGDFRAGGLLNMAVLAATAAGLILFVRRLRGGITDPADTFFPLTLLHFGHSVDVLFPFQITFVLTLGFILIVGCALFLPASVTTPRAAAVAGGTLLLLPLSGFIGLLFVPALAMYIFYAGWACWSGSRGWPARRGLGAWLMTASGGAVVLAALYFVGYEHPWWNPPNPGVVPSFKVMLKVLSLGFGPAPYLWWAPGVAAALLLLAASSWAAVHRLQRAAPDREYALGAAVFVANTIVFAAAVGWGRAGSVPDVGIPLRYIGIVMPAFVASYLVWVVSPSRFATAVQRTLAVTMLLLLPLNTVAGHRLFAEWYHDGMSRLHADIDNGVPVEELAVRYNRFLAHYWSPAELARHIHMLRNARIPPFDRAAVQGNQAP
ncbi:MAG: hypothetical protein M3468_13710 [Acidobacteriota bacterium]|nr:hypothetical protein [Acidobacteriota bacterium]